MPPHQNLAIRSIDRIERHIRNSSIDLPLSGDKLAEL
jgi:hypothetical protein